MGPPASPAGEDQSQEPRAHGDGDRPRQSGRDDERYEPGERAGTLRGKTPVDVPAFVHARREVFVHVKSVRASWLNGIAALVAVLILTAAVLYLRVPYFALTPGPAQDVGRLIVINGARTTPVEGQLLLTTVSLHEIRVAEAVRGWFDPTTAILSRSTIVPPGSTDADVAQRTSALMEESHIFAAAAALGLLGYEIAVEPSGVRVRAVGSNVPAAALLRRGDVVVGADGRPVKQAEDLVAAIKRHKVGDDVGLRIMRGTEALDVATRTVGRPENPAEPIIGVEIETIPDIRLPLAVNIESMGIGGPSAGLMFALGIYDLLDPKDLTAGRIIAGTGEIGIEGNVGTVGGIRQKIESARRVQADVFIVPTGELGQACAAAKEMPVVGVDNLRQAVEALRGTRGTPVRSCP